MAANDHEIEKDFASMLQHKAPKLPKNEINDCLAEICTAIDQYFQFDNYYKHITKPSSARKSLGALHIHVNSLINRFRLLDPSSLTHLIHHGYKPSPTLTTLRQLLSIVERAENEAKSARNKPTNDSLTYLVGRIHFSLTKVLKPYKRRSTKLLVNDVISLIAPSRHENWIATRRGFATQIVNKLNRMRIPDDIGRYFDNAKKFNGIF